MMADLSENAVWASGIRQIETTDPVIGGAPNAGTGDGMVNIPHLELANRTAWLREQAYAGVMAWESTRTYNEGDTVAHASRLWLATANSTDSEPTPENALWAPLWTSDDATLVTGSNGYRIEPDGFITQWCKATLSVPSAINSDSVVTVNFPISFPDELFDVQVSQGLSGSETAEMALGILSQSLSQVQVRVRRISGSNTGSETVSINIRALGN